MENTKKTGPMIAGGIVLAILVIGGIYMASKGATGQANISDSQIEDTVDQIQADYQSIGDVNLDAELTGIDQELQ